MKMVDFAHRVLQKYIYQEWNIAIATMNNDLSLSNIKWMQHNFKDRWYADPFIVDDSDDYYIILAEEYMHINRKGRIARLTVSKKDCVLVNNETILDLPTHLSFPNTMAIDGDIYLYPENAESGNTKYYKYGDTCVYKGTLSLSPLADPTIFRLKDKYYLFATLDDECNGNRLRVFESNKALGEYKEVQQIVFSDCTARRAGNVFFHNGEMISPAQICNDKYGQGICFQKITLSDDGKFSLTDIRRDFPPTRDYPEGFHTYNIYKNNCVVIDGYRYGSKMLHNLYVKIRRTGV